MCQDNSQVRGCQQRVWARPIANPMFSTVGLVIVSQSGLTREG